MSNQNRTVAIYDDYLFRTHRFRPTQRVQNPLAQWISGPLLDRIDIHVEVPHVPFDKLVDDCLGD